MPLNVNGLALAESKRTNYRIVVEPDVKPNDLLEPLWWVHVAQLLRSDDQIEVCAHDRSWYGVVMVLEAGRRGVGGARVAFINGPLDLSNEAVVPKVPDIEVRWTSARDQWSVVRDKIVVKAGFPTKEEATTYASALKAAA